MAVGYGDNGAVLGRKLCCKSQEAVRTKEMGPSPDWGDLSNSEPRQFLLERFGCLAIRPSETFVEGLALLRAAEEHRLEGIVSRRRDAPYRSGERRDWRKFKSSPARGEYGAIVAIRVINTPRPLLCGIGSMSAAEERGRHGGGGVVMRAWDQPARSVGGGNSVDIDGLVPSTCLCHAASIAPHPLPSALGR